MISDSLWKNKFSESNLSKKKTNEESLKELHDPQILMDLEGLGQRMANKQTRGLPQILLRPSLKKENENQKTNRSSTTPTSSKFFQSITSKIVNGSEEIKGGEIEEKQQAIQQKIRNPFNQNIKSLQIPLITSNINNYGTGKQIKSTLTNKKIQPVLSLHKEFAKMDQMENNNNSIYDRLTFNDADIADSNQLTENQGITNFLPVYQKKAKNQDLQTQKLKGNQGRDRDTNEAFINNSKNQEINGEYDQQRKCSLDDRIKQKHSLTSIRFSGILLPERKMKDLKEREKLQKLKKDIGLKNEKDKPEQEKNTPNQNEFSSYQQLPQILRNQSSTTSIKQSATNDPLEDYKLGSLIGKGSYALVKIAKDIQRNEQVAIKFYEKYKLFDPQKKKNVQQEISILKQISHPNCIQMMRTFENKKHVCVVMEYVGKESMYSYLKQYGNRRLPENEAKRIFKQIILGVQYLHENNIVHRDIKLENLLMDEEKNIKIIDFGFAISLQFDPKKKLNVFCGTPSYMAPELVSKQQYLGPPADIWACGVLLYAMLVGTFPFKAADERTLFHKIKVGQFDIPEYVSSGAKSMLNKILNTNPVDRFTAKEILESKWIDPMNIFKQSEQTEGRQLYGVLDSDSSGEASEFEEKDNLQYQPKS